MLHLLQNPSELEIIKRWWNCVSKRKDVYNGICTAVLDNMVLSELEPLGLDERTAETLEKAEIFTVEDLVSRNIDDIVKIKFIGEISLWKVLRAISLLPTLSDELKDDYFKSLAPNFEVVVNKRFDFTNSRFDFVGQ
jgi:DNA-directed RNA polymerase alpha subunit